MVLPFRPLDDADTVFIEMFTKTGIQKLFRARHPVQIEVDKSYHAICQLYRVRLGQRVSRAFLPARHSRPRAARRA